MDFKQIEAFISVAKHKNFSKAAKALFLSQPTVSAHIMNLEKELEVKLFDRTSKMVHLTSHGEKFLEYAVEMVNVKKTAFTSIQAIDTDLSGNIKIMTSSTPNASIVPEFVSIYHGKYPEVKIQIVENDSQSIINEILKTNLEIGFVGNYQSDEKIEVLSSFSDEVVVVSHYRMNLSDEVSLEDLTMLPFLYRKKGSATQKIFADVLKKSGKEIEDLHGVIECDHMSTLIQLLKRNLGFAVMSKEVFHEFDLGYVLKSSTIKNCSMNRTVHLVGHAQRTLSPQAKRFVEIVSNYQVKG